MSEEEIKETIKDFLELNEIHSNNSIRRSYLTIYQEAIQGLLDLYQKEKEKNEKAIDKIKYYFDTGGSGTIALNDVRELLEERN